MNIVAWVKRVATLVSALLAAVVASSSVLNAAPLNTAPTFSDYATPAALAYCLAKHPVQTDSRTFSDDGYEYAHYNPAIVGAARRNFLFGRDLDATIDPNSNAPTCQQACEQIGKLYGSTYYTGAALRRKVGSNEYASGIGDVAAAAMQDKDFYLNKTIISGFWARLQTYHESDVAQADMCCCHMKPAQ